MLGKRANRTRMAGPFRTSGGIARDVTCEPSRTCVTWLTALVLHEMFSGSNVEQAVMQEPVEAPTPRALADLVARCTQIDRFTVQLVAAEESRIAAMASGMFAMRGVLQLAEIPADRLPARQSRIRHWCLAGGELGELATNAIRKLDGTLVVDEHEQVKILSRRTWRGVWRVVTLWRDGVHGLSSRDLLEYLAKLAAHANELAPAAARELLARSEAVAASRGD